MAKTTKYTAEVSEGRDELLDGKTIARLRTIAVKNQRGETVRELKAADNDEDVRAKLRAAGYTHKDWAGGTTPATLERGRNPLVAGCLWPLVAVMALLAWAIFSAFSNASPDEPEEWDAKIACQTLVKEKLRAPSTAKFSRETASGGPKAWTVTGAVEAENALGGTVGHRYSCSVTFTGDDEYRGTATITDR